MKSRNPSTTASRSLPSFHCGFIALTPTFDKSWSVPVRAKPCETQSLTESLVAEGFLDFYLHSDIAPYCLPLSALHT